MMMMTKTARNILIHNLHASCLQTKNRQNNDNKQQQQKTDKSKLKIKTNIFLNSSSTWNRFEPFCRFVTANSHFLIAINHNLGVKDVIVSCYCISVLHALQSG